MNHERILIIDDESSIRSALQGILEDEGCSVRSAASGEEGLEILARENFGLVLLDIWLPGMNGLEVLTEIQRLEERPAVVVISGHGTVEMAVKAVKLGAYDFLEKPLSLEKVVLTVENAVRRSRLEEENIRLRERLQRRCHLVGKSAVIRSLRARIKAVAPTDGGVLLTGENGTGKELIARLIHRHSRRRDKRFVEVNCAALPENLIDAELFGYHKGYGPNPAKEKKGKLLQSEGGTLFLDGVGVLPPSTQSALVRALSTGSFEPLGASEPASFDARILAATRWNLGDLARQGRFNEDLFFKLNVIPMNLPPLRERTEDIPSLIAYFLRIYCLEYGRTPKTMNSEALQAFVNYPWPGNISELMNVLERFVILVDDREIGLAHLNLFVEIREHILSPAPRPSLEESLRWYEKDFIHQALRRNNWDEPRTADELGIEPAALRAKIRRLEIALND